MATVPQAFYCLWQEERIREKLFSLLSKEDICAVRVANSACCNLITKRLFQRTHLTFTAHTFTKPIRIQALSRIGHHIEHLTFTFAHSDATFLPPLIHPQTGREICFLYTPHTSMASVLARPRYANSELGEILTQQYPPMFHAASNVPSFINAMKHMPNMRHLTIKTPGQNPKERYRRDIVDYALISLRISLERAPLYKLNKLSLSGVHPSAFNYLRYAPGAFGASPSAERRWRQIKKLYVSVESWDFYSPSSPGLDHLKIMDDYIRCFAPHLEKFSFTWFGRKGPCPLALSADPLFAPPRNTKKLFNEVTGPMSPLPPRPSRKPLVMPRLRFMSVRNATMNAQQLRGLVASHKATVREFDFENVVLINGGSWDEALAPLTNGNGSDSWSRHSIGGSENGSFRPPAAAPPPPSLSRSGSGRSERSVRSGAGSGSGASSHPDEQLQVASSAAATAASKELFDIDLEGMVFGGINDVHNLNLLDEAGVEQWALGVTAAATGTDSQVSSSSRHHHREGSSSSMMDMIPEADEDVVAQIAETDGGLASDIEAAREASLAFSTKLKKRRIRKRKSRKHIKEDGEDDARSERTEGRRSESRHQSRSRGHKHSRSDETSDRGHQHGSRDNDENRDRERSHSRHRRHHRRHRSAEEMVPAMPPLPPHPLLIPEVIGTDDEAIYFPSRAAAAAAAAASNRPQTPPKTPPQLLRRDTPPRSSPSQRSSPQRSPPRSPPRLTPQPSANMEEMNISAPILNPDPFPVLLQPTVYDPSVKAGPFVKTEETNSECIEDDGLSAVQRSIEADILMAEAEEAAARSSALQRAKQAVLTKLSKEFCKRKMSASHTKDSAAVIAGLSSLNLGGHPALQSCASSNNMNMGMGYRIREGLFGRSMANVASVALTEHTTRSLEVPLIFSRS